MDESDSAETDTDIKIDLNKCLCHILPKCSSKEVSFRERSWQTFKTAADERQDNICRIMAGHWTSGPKGVYHRECYQTYTSKWHISRLQKEKEKGEGKRQADEELSHHCKKMRRSESPIDKTKCFLCRKPKFVRTLKGRRCERLTTCMTLKACNAIRDAAERKKDEQILLHIRHSPDLIAGKIMYHKSCYREYTRQENTPNKHAEEEKLNVPNVYDEAFEKLAQEIEKNVIDEKNVTNMRDLLKRYKEILSEQDIDASDYRTYHLKRRMKKYFGGIIAFWHPHNKAQTELVYAEDIEKGELVNQCNRPQEVDTEDWDVTIQDQDIDIERTVYHAACYIRKILMNFQPVMNWPPKAVDLDACNLIIPTMLFNMLAWIISSQKPEYIKDEKVHVADSTARKISSIAQDLIHCATNAHIKTPKHYVLPLTIKSG